MKARMEAGKLMQAHTELCERKFFGSSLESTPAASLSPDDASALISIRKKSSQAVRFG